MRVSSERKAETHNRILQAAIALFRSHGIDAVGVDAVMRRAGLTHGGFYAHFLSKEALVAEATAASLARSAERWEQISQGEDHQAAFRQIVGGYLDQVHLSAAERGCVLATLGSEVARRPELRSGLSRSIRQMAAALARCMPGRRRQRALAILSGLVGAVVLARLADDPTLADQILRSVRKDAGLD